MTLFYIPAGEPSNRKLIVQNTKNNKKVLLFRSVNNEELNTVDVLHNDEIIWSGPLNDFLANIQASAFDW